MNQQRVTVVLFADEDGGYTAVIPYFSCRLLTPGFCLTAQGETREEALAESRARLAAYLRAAGAEGRYHLEYARLDEVEITEIELDEPEP